MTPQEKAKQLLWEYLPILEGWTEGWTDEGKSQLAKRYALMAVDEIVLEQCKSSELKNARYQDERLMYWEEVKQEIEKI